MSRDSNQEKPMTAEQIDAKRRELSVKRDDLLIEKGGLIQQLNDEISKLQAKKLTFFGINKDEEYKLKTMNSMLREYVNGNKFEGKPKRDANQTKIIEGDKKVSGIVKRFDDWQTDGANLMHDVEELKAASSTAGVGMEKQIEELMVRTVQTVAKDTPPPPASLSGPK